MSFKSKIILVSGGASGVGAETSWHFARLGGSVAIVDRNGDGLEQVAEEIKLTYGISPLAIVADITHFGKLDVLVNNAGIVERNNIENITLDSFDRLFNVNVKGTIRLTQLSIPYLEKTKGSIVNISRLCGFRPVSDHLGYCLSKSAVDQFTKCVVLELAPKGIRVNAVNPGIVDIPIFYTLGYDEEGRRQAVAEMGPKHPLGRVAQAIDIAEAITFLASESSAFITGILLSVDGGKSIQI